ncbi:MAG: lipooligosaccharide sialyltransferase [Lachnospiraceae bacterium]|nr:lipooligosaccharide sialyltransferase [Lachnospiraceae bacterium]
MKERIYICHTFYHVYVACLKELDRRRKNAAAAGAAGRGTPRAEDTATLMLSTMSNDFGSLPARAEKCPLFDEVVIFPEKPASAYEELAPLQKNTGSAIGNLLGRIRFCKRLGQLTEQAVPVDLKQYGDIYVFCDSDPIGYYLNYKGIRYHALEDGLNCIANFDAARYDNRDHFALKAAIARTGLIFIQNGYGRYCIDMEVNDLSVLKYPCPKYVELPRKSLTDALTEEDKEILLSLFLEDREGLLRQLEEGKGRPRVLILSEPLCDLKTRERLFRDIVDTYGAVDGERALVMIKQHPRDRMDYSEKFGDCILLSSAFPMEMLNFVPGLSFDRLVSVYTVVDALQFVKEKIILGHDFMDRYEAPEIHRKNEKIGA